MSELIPAEAGADVVTVEPPGGDPVRRREQHDWGRMERFGAYWDLGGAPLALDRACPAVGEHTEEVLAELGHSPAEVAALEATGVVRTPTERTTK